MNEQLAVQTLLQRKFAELQSANPRYSLRSFSRKVGMNPGALSGILNGKRNVSAKLAERIAERLLLDPQERSELFGQFRVLRTRIGEEGTSEDYRRLTAAQFKVTAEWEHFAVLSLIKIRGFKSDAEWIAGRLGITAARAREVIRRLVDAGMASLEADGKLKRTAPRFRTTDDVADASVRRSHEQSLELARRSLEADAVQDRDHTWLMLPMDPKNLSVAKEKIRQFQDELSQLAGTGDRAEVYRLSMHLYPLTK